MPALVNSSVGSSCGTTGDDGTKTWPRSRKKSINTCRTRSLGQVRAVCPSAAADAILEKSRGREGREKVRPLPATSIASCSGENVSESDRGTFKLPDKYACTRAGQRGRGGDGQTPTIRRGRATAVADPVERGWRRLSQDGSAPQPDTPVPLDAMAFGWALRSLPVSRWRTGSGRVHRARWQRHRLSFARSFRCQADTPSSADGPHRHPPSPVRNLSYAGASAHPTVARRRADGAVHIRHIHGCGGDDVDLLGHVVVHVRAVYCHHAGSAGVLQSGARQGHASGAQGQHRRHHFGHGDGGGHSGTGRGGVSGVGHAHLHLHAAEATETVRQHRRHQHHIHGHVLRRLPADVLGAHARTGWRGADAVSGGHSAAAAPAVAGMVTAAGQLDLRGGAHLVDVAVDREQRCGCAFHRAGIRSTQTERCVAQEDRRGRVGRVRVLGGGGHAGRLPAQVAAVVADRLVLRHPGGRGGATGRSDGVAVQARCRPEGLAGGGVRRPFPLDAARPRRYPRQDR
eukprot:ctg_16.g4